MEKGNNGQYPEGFFDKIRTIGEMRKHTNEQTAKENPEMPQYCLNNHEVPAGAEQCTVCAAPILTEEIGK